MRVVLIASRGRSLVNFRGPLIDAMLAHGHEVHVIQPGDDDGPDMSIVLSAKGAHVHSVKMDRTGTSLLADAGMLLGLFRTLLRIKADVLLAYTIKPVIYGLLAAWICRVPKRCALITGLGYAFTQPSAGGLGQLVPWLYSIALKRAHLVFFQNPDDQTLFQSRGILPNNVRSVVVNGSGVDLAAFSAVPVPTGTARFLLIGRLLGAKGVREYAKAARRVRALYPNVRFVLVGWIDEAPDAIGQAELGEWIASGDIEYLGRLDDVRPALSECNVFVLPSYREGTPRTVLEAMAVGRAIITTDAPGCRETVNDSDNGFLVPVKSVDRLVEAMSRFIEAPELAVSMGQRSREIAESKYDVHLVNIVMLREIGLSVGSK